MLACPVFDGQVVFGVRHTFPFQLDLREKLTFHKKKLNQGCVKKGISCLGYALQLKTVIRSQSETLQSVVSACFAAIL